MAVKSINLVMNNIDRSTSILLELFDRLKVFVAFLARMHIVNWQSLHSLRTLKAAEPVG